jgi:hypothetical protein
MDGRAVWQIYDRTIVIIAVNSNKGKKRRFTMYKKKLAILAAAAMLTLSASSAFAAFGNLELIRVVLDNAGTTEIVTDLGTVSSVLAGGSFGDGANAFTSVAGGTSSSLNVTYFAVNQATKEVWITGSALKSSAGKSVTVTGMSTSIWNYYNTLTAAGSATATYSANASSGYHVLADATTQQGQFGSFIAATGRPSVEASLANLASASVTQDLYYFSNYAVAQTGVKVGSIITNADGSTSTPLTATPIPAAFYLMGSGLMGLVGLRRRNKIA